MPLEKSKGRKQCDFHAAWKMYSRHRFKSKHIPFVRTRCLIGLDIEGVRCQSILLALNANMFEVMQHLYCSSYLDTKVRVDIYNEFNRDKRREYYDNRCAEDPVYAARVKELAAQSAVRTRTARYARAKKYRHRYREWHARHARTIRATVPYYNIRNRLSSRLWHAVIASKSKKAAKTEELIGCTVRELQLHLQSQFTDGMTWDKFLSGEIHIDHKVPCSTFDLRDPEQQKVCFHFTNLQPLWEKDNLSKSDRLVDGRLGRTVKQNAL